jgi:hypothetical protein
MKTLRDMKAHLYAVLTTALDAPAAFAREKAFSTHWIGGGMEAVEKRKIYLSPARNRTKILLDSLSPKLWKRLWTCRKTDQYLNLN